MDTEQIRLRIAKTEANALRQISEEVGVPYVSLLAVFIKASLEAAIENGKKIPLPLRFEIKDPCPSKKLVRAKGADSL